MMKKLEAGKRYVRRDGSVTPKLEDVGTIERPIVFDPETRFIFSTDAAEAELGLVFPGSIDSATGAQLEHPHDLIREASVEDCGHGVCDEE